MKLVCLYIALVSPHWGMADVPGALRVPHLTQGVANSLGSGAAVTAWLVMHSTRPGSSAPNKWNTLQRCVRSRLTQSIAQLKLRVETARRVPLDHVLKGHVHLRLAGEPCQFDPSSKARQRWLVWRAK